MSYGASPAMRVRGKREPETPATSVLDGIRRKILPFISPKDRGRVAGIINGEKRRLLKISA